MGIGGLFFLVLVALIQAYAAEQSYEPVKTSSVGMVTRNVNVRSKPSTDANVLGTLKKGQKLKVLGRYNQQWYLVSIKRKKVWVWAKNVVVRPLPRQQNKPTSPTSREVKASVQNIEVIQYPSARTPEQSTLVEDKNVMTIFDRYTNHN